MLARCLLLPLLMLARCLFLNDSAVAALMLIVPMHVLAQRQQLQRATAITKEFAVLRCGSAVRYCLFAARYCYHDGVRLAAMRVCNALLPLCSALLISRRSSPCCAVGLQRAAASLQRATDITKEFALLRCGSARSACVRCWVGCC